MSKGGARCASACSMRLAYLDEELNHGKTDMRMFVAPYGTRRSVTLGPQAPSVLQSTGEGGRSSVMLVPRQ
eukprot:scaffold26582_cov40-Tisochrysis_lutea.AAC.2